MREREGGPLRSVGGLAAGYCPDNSEENEEEDRFDPGPIDPDKEPDLYPLNPHDNWVCLKQQALSEGEFDIAERIVAPVVYLGP